MSTDTKETRTRQPRQVGRVYDFDNGVAKLTLAFDPSFSLDAALSAIPATVINGFALQSVADYVAAEVNEVMKEKLPGETDEAQRERAKQVAQEAWAELVEGKVDFRTGAGIGGMRSVIGALGAVLFEMGKTFVKNQRGETLAFSDVHSAREAVKALYQDTEPKGPFAPKLDAQNQPVLDKEGKPRMVAVNPDSHLTGRMIFNAICEMPSVKGKLEEALAGVKKDKPTIQVELG